MIKQKTQLRIINIATSLIKSKGTVRSIANQFGISKSCVHYYMVKLLPKIDENLFIKIRKLLDINKLERAYRGGKATSLMYKAKKINLLKSS